MALLVEYVIIALIAAAAAAVGAVSEYPQSVEEPVRDPTHVASDVIT